MVESIYQTQSHSGGSSIDMQSAVATEINGNKVLLTTAHGLDDNTSLSGNIGDTFVSQTNMATGEENKFSAPFAISKKFDLAVVDVNDDLIADSDIVELAEVDSLAAGDEVSGEKLLTGKDSQAESKPAIVESVDEENGTIKVDETKEKFEKGNSGGQILDQDGNAVALVQGSETIRSSGKDGVKTNESGVAINLTDSEVRQEINSLTQQLDAVA